MIIYGLDLSLNSTGISIYDSVEEEFIYIDHVLNNDKEYRKIDDDMVYGLKLKRIYDKFIELKEIYPPDKVVCESSFTRFNKVTQVLYRVHGITALAFAGMPIIYYTPKTIKNAVYTGNASKDEIAEVLTRRLGIEFTVDDESDATAIVITYLKNNGLIEWKDVKALTAKEIRKRELAQKKKDELKKSKAKK